MAFWELVSVLGSTPSLSQNLGAIPPHPMVFFQFPKQTFFSNPFVRVLVIERRFKLKLPFDSLEFLSPMEAILRHCFRCPCITVTSTCSKWNKDFIPKSCIDTYSFLKSKGKQNPNTIYEYAQHTLKGPQIFGAFGVSGMDFPFTSCSQYIPHYSHLDHSGSFQGSLMFLMHLGYRFFDLMPLNLVLYIGANTTHAKLEQCNICITLIMHFQIQGQGLVVKARMVGSRVIFKKNSM